MEARCTVEGVFGDLPIEWGNPEGEDARHAGIFSLVVDDTSGKTRSLPSLYHGNALIFVHRDLDQVAGRLTTTVGAVLESSTRATYLMAACRAGDRVGLYAHDACNRDPFRLRAGRAGLVLSEEPHLRMNADGTFECDGWPAFHPEFVVVKPVSGRDSQKNVNKGAFLTFLFGILRLGSMTPSELRHVAGLVKSIPIVAAGDPMELLQLIEEIPENS